MKHTKFYFLVASLLMVYHTTQGDDLPKYSDFPPLPPEYNDSLDYDFGAFTLDQLVWFRDAYHLNTSPLSTLKGYQDVYPIAEDIYIFPAEVVEDKNYAVSWVVKNDSLYAVNIFLEKIIDKNFKEKHYPDSTMWRILADFMHSKVEIDALLPCYGATYEERWSRKIFAQGYNGTLYARKKIKRLYSEIPNDLSGREFDNYPILKMKFRKGILHSVKVIRPKLLKKYRK